MKNLHSYNIAAAKRINGFPQFVQAVSVAAREHGLIKLVGLTAADGRGCLNLGLMFEGNEADATEFVEQVTWALMPSKYSTLPHGDPLLTEGEFVDMTVTPHCHVVALPEEV